jgi:hypothetical protein
MRFVLAERLRVRRRPRRGYYREHDARSTLRKVNDIMGLAGVALAAPTDFPAATFRYRFSENPCILGAACGTTQ